MTLSSEQAFKAMSLFLERQYERTKSDDIGALLGDLQLAEDGKPFDPAAWDEWLKSVEQALEKNQR
jgi:hypothetical protein